MQSFITGPQGEGFEIFRVADSTSAQAQAINDSGMVAGTYSNDLLQGIYTKLPGLPAAKLTRGSGLGTVVFAGPGWHSRVTGLNASGQVTGITEYGMCGPDWNREKYVALGFWTETNGSNPQFMVDDQKLCFPYYGPESINDAGQIVGRLADSLFSEDGQPFKRYADGEISVRARSKPEYSYATLIDNEGRSVGTWRDATDTGIYFASASGHVASTRQVVKGLPPGVRLYDAYAINRANQILARDIEGNEYLLCPHRACAR